MLIRSSIKNAYKLCIKLILVAPEQFLSNETAIPYGQREDTIGTPTLTHIQIHEQINAINQVNEQDILNNTHTHTHLC